MIYVDCFLDPWDTPSMYLTMLNNCNIQCRCPLTLCSFLFPLNLAAFSVQLKFLFLEKYRSLCKSFWVLFFRSFAFFPTARPQPWIIPWSSYLLSWPLIYALLAMPLIYTLTTPSLSRGRAHYAIYFCLDHPNPWYQPFTAWTWPLIFTLYILDSTFPSPDLKFNPDYMDLSFYFTYLFLETDMLSNRDGCPSQIWRQLLCLMNNSLSFEREKYWLKPVCLLKNINFKTIIDNWRMNKKICILLIIKYLTDFNISILDQNEVKRVLPLYPFKSFYSKNTK